MTLPISFQGLDLPESTKDELQQILTVLQSGGEKWKSVPYAAHLYGQQSPGVWTVSSDNHKSYRYCVVGNILHLHVHIGGSDTNATMDSELHIYLPPGYQVGVPEGDLYPTLFCGQVIWFDNTGGTNGVGIVMANFQDNLAQDLTRVTLLRGITGVAWPISSTDFGVIVQAAVPIQPR